MESHYVPGTVLNAENTAMIKTNIYLNSSERDSR